MWVWSTCPWWNREVQITEFVKQWIRAQLHSEADASKDGQIRPHIRPHIRRPYPAGAGYGRIWKYGRISAGAGAGYDIRCNLSLVWSSDRMTKKQSEAEDTSLCSCTWSVSTSENDHFCIFVDNDVSIKRWWVSVLKFGILGPHPPRSPYKGQGLTGHGPAWVPHRILRCVSSGSGGYVGGHARLKSPIAP